MRLSERAAARRKSKDLKNEVKQFKKEFLSAGGEKSTANGAVKEFGEILELGGSLCAGYREAREHLSGAREAIEALLARMGEGPAEETRKCLEKLTGELEQGYDDCLIQRDDLDFQSSVQCLGRMTAEAGGADRTGMPFVMLRSELENIKAVLDDVLGRNAPDFFSLAYFFKNGDRDSLKEMENEQRNTYVLIYTKDNFLNAFMRECGKAGMGARVQEMIRKHVYGEQAKTGFQENRSGK